MAIKDFQANQVRTTKIIGSGSIGGQPAVIIYSSSNAGDFIGGVSDTNMLAKVGTDVFLFVSGTKTGVPGGSAQRQNVTVFGGDLLVSGTLYAERSVIEVDGDVTGSLWVSGSLIVSQSVTIYEGLTVNETGEGGSENDFRVESNTKTHALFVDASTDRVYVLSASGGTPIEVRTDRVLILSGGGASGSANESAYPDTNFFVSGTIGSKDSSVKGTSLFGGDLVVSGNTYLAMSGASNTLADVGNDTNFFVSGTIGSKDSSVKGTALFGGDMVVSGSLWATAAQIGSIRVSSTHNGPNADYWLKVAEIEGNSGAEASTATFFINCAGGTGATAFNTDSAYVHVRTGPATSPACEQCLVDLINAPETNALDKDDFYLTWTTSAPYSAELWVRSPNTFREVFISVVGTPSVDTAYVNKWNILTDQSWGASFSSLGKTVASEYTDRTFEDVSAYRMLIMSGVSPSNMTEGGSTVILDVRGNGSTDQVFFLSGSGAATSPNESAYTDTNFFVSGSSGSMDTTVRGTAVFGGDLVVSGGFKIKGIHTGISASYFETGEIRTPTGDLLIDVAGDIEINADGGNVVFKDGSDTRAEILREGKLSSLRGLQISGSVNSDPFAQLVGGHTPWMIGDLSTNLTHRGFILQQNSAGGNGAIVLAPGQNGSLILGLGRNQTPSAYGSPIEADGLAEMARGVTAQVLILSGITTSDPNPASWTDTNFFVDGVAGSKDSSTKGTAVFRGDLVISGASYSAAGISGSYLETGFIKATGKLLLTASEGILILSGGAATSLDSSTFLDTNFFVSGSIGSAHFVGGGKPTSRGTSVFGGDLVASGNLNVGKFAKIDGGLEVTGSISGRAIAQIVDPSYPWIIGDPEGRAHRGYIMQQASSGPGGIDGDIILMTGKKIIIGVGRTGLPSAFGSPIWPATGLNNDYSRGATNQVLILSGITVQDPDPRTWTDTHFFVDGVAGSKDSATKGTAVFRGDLIVSGNTYLAMSGSRVNVLENVGSDTNFFVSGSAGSKDGAVKGTALFGGDLVASGSILPGAHNTYDLGATANRWANVYTADLHLQNDRGDWTIVEEEDMLVVVNNKSGKRFKMMLEELED